MPFSSDITTGNIAIASSNFSGFPPSQAIDDNNSTDWAASGAALPQWVGVDFYGTLTDQATGGTESADSEFSGSFPATNAFDDSTSDWASTDTAFPHWIKYDRGASNDIIVKSYSIKASASSPARAPKDFNFQGSNNDSTWTDLDIRTGITFTAGEEKIFTNFTEGENTTSYRYYRINATDNNDGGTDICQLDEVQISLQLGNTEIITQYTIRASSSQAGRAPKDFTFQGSNDPLLVSWTTIDTQSGITFTASELKTYNGFSNSTGYRFYRINTTLNDDANNFIQLAELEMMEELGFSPDNIDLVSSVEAPTIKIDYTTNPNVLDIVTSVETLAGVGNLVTITPTTLDLVSSLETPTIIINATITATSIDLVTSIENISISIATQNASKVISFNPLIYVTNTSPAQIVEVDISDPLNPTSNVQSLTGFDNAVDVAYDSTSGFFYVACANGEICKVDSTNLSSFSLLDTTDTDDIQTIEALGAFGQIYAGTDNELGELYIIDQRNTFSIETDIKILAEQQFQIETEIQLIQAFNLDGDIRVLGEKTFFLDTDIKVLDPVVVDAPVGTEPLDAIIPIKLIDFHVFLDTVELANTDLQLQSISVTHSIDIKSTANFILNRRHDDFNTDPEGATKTISNQNNIVIKIKDVEIFNGKISEINPVGDIGIDEVLVNCLSDQPQEKFNNVTLSLASLTERLSLYHVLANTPRIYNPFIDPNDEDPIRFKGISVDLGTNIQERLSRFTIFDSTGSIATNIQDGNFNPKQNWQYFWSPTCRKFGNIALSEVVAVTFNYIGTSLGPVSEDLWNLTNAKHRRQRLYDSKETVLGTYTVGVAPFQIIRPRNGRLNTKFKWVDRDDGLYSIKAAATNYEEFAKRVADLEYQKLLNINGQILPETSCTLRVTADAYLFYDFNLLTRISIDNTTSSNIFNSNNGFPVAIKSITITSVDREVILECDNIKSTTELEEINGDFPDEDDDEYHDPVKEIFIAAKTDMNTRLTIA